MHHRRQPPQQRDDFGQEDRSDTIVKVNQFALQQAALLEAQWESQAAELAKSELRLQARDLLQSLSQTVASLEKSLNITMAAQSGANLITQAAGTQAGLMVSSFTACVIDNDMIGSIARSLADIPVNVDTLSLELIESTVNNEGHFLGAKDTFSRMKSDFLYPKVSDRTSFDEWTMAGRVDISQKATIKAKEILKDYFPNHIKPDFIKEIRNNFEIKIETHKMRSQ